MIVKYIYKYTIYTIIFRVSFIVFRWRLYTLVPSRDFASSTKSVDPLYLFHVFPLKYEFYSSADSLFTILSLILPETSHFSFSSRPCVSSFYFVGNRPLFRTNGRILARRHVHSPENRLTQFTVCSVRQSSIATTRSACLVPSSVVLLSLVASMWQLESVFARNKGTGITSHCERCFI